MTPQTNSRILYALPAALAIWLVAAGLALLWIQPGTVFLSMALLAFTATLALTGLFRYSNWAGAIVSIGVFAAALIALYGFTSGIWMPLTALAAAVLVVALLGGWISDEIRRLYRQLVNDQKLIEELRLFDPATGVMRFRYVHQALHSEILRSQRYDKRLCVMLIDIGTQEGLHQELGVNGLARAKRQVVELLPSSLRAMDIAFSGEKIGAILPETTQEGSQIVIDRVIERVERKLHLPLNIGVAQFPTDGVTEGELLQAAEAALQVSQRTGQTSIQYEQLQQAAQKSSNP